MHGGWIWPGRPEWHIVGVACVWRHIFGVYWHFSHLRRQTELPGRYLMWTARVIRKKEDSREAVKSKANEREGDGSSRYSVGYSAYYLAGAQQSRAGGPPDGDAHHPCSKLHAEHPPGPPSTVPFHPIDCCPHSLAKSPEVSCVNSQVLSGRSPKNPLRWTRCAALATCVAERLPCAEALTRAHRTHRIELPILVVAKGLQLS